MITWSDVHAVVTNPVFAFVGGIAITGFLTYARRNLRTLEYTVHHDRIGVTANDATLGSVTVQWQGQPLANLYLTNVVLTNPTWHDFTQLTVRAYTRSDTVLLNQYTEIPGTTQVLIFTPEFNALITVAPDAAATEAQLELYRHRRDFVVPVLNRGHSVVIRFLTTVPAGGQGGPVVLIDMLYPGARVEFRRLEALIHNVPVRFALPLGMLASVVILALCASYLSSPWAVGGICLFVGLFAQSFGAAIHKVYRLGKRLIAG